jgi:hypothetical protein
LKGKIFLIVCILLAGIIIRQSLENLYKEKRVQEGTVTTYEDGSRVGRNLSYAETVPEDNKILEAFYEQFPTATMLVACEEDLTNDGKKDLVVIYNTPEADEASNNTALVNGGHIRLTVMIDLGNGEEYKHTEPIPAPIENQKIQFQNIDKADEMEFVLQGQKGTKVGYGIFRVIDGKTMNLFGEGMEEC